MVRLEATLDEICEFDLSSVCADPVVSPDSKKIAYPIRSTGLFSSGMKACVNGSTQRQYAGVAGLRFSPDSQHLVYVATQKGKGVVVVRDGEVISKKYDMITFSTPIFSPDSRHIAFGAMANGKWFAVKDGIEEGPFDGFVIGTMTFSPNSRLSYAYYSGQLRGRKPIGGKCTVIIDRKKVAEYDQNKRESIVEKSLRFSLDSNRFAYGAVRNGKFFPVVDGKEFHGYNRIGANILFTPDSRQFAYLVSDDMNTWNVMIDGQIKKKVQGEVQWMEFSPDSHHFAYAYWQQISSNEQEAHLVIDEREKTGYKGILTNFHSFSPDSRRFAYGGEINLRQFAVIDDKEQKDYWGLPTISPAFSPDSKHFVYATSPSASTMLVVVDGTELDIGFNLINGSKFVFDAPNKFHTLVPRNNKIHQLNVQIRE